MKTISFFCVGVMICVLAAGCGTHRQTTTGFLSDYSKLEKVSESSYQYMDKAAKNEYQAFIVDPVKVQIYSEQKRKQKLTDDQINDITSYLHKKMVEAVEGAGKRIVHWPAPGVARLRIALTDLHRTDAINLLPQASLVGAGVGGASIEAEAVDAMSGRQIGALVESRQGGKIPFSNMGEWTAAKSVVDQWTKRFQERLSN